MARTPTRLTLMLVAAASAMTLLAQAAWAGSSSVAYSFAGDEDGEYPSTELVIDGAGNLYGTTVQGGEVASGTVFQLAPDGAGGWNHTVLYSFTSGADGGQPYGGVTLDAQGNLYGTAVVGGSFAGLCAENGCGVVYELRKAGSSWSFHVLHAFNGTDGSGPGAGVTVDGDGAVFGMAPTGGANGLGVIYQLKPRTGGGWRFRVIHDFTGGADGATGSAGRLLLEPGTGNLYGVATVGGANDQGVAFELVRRNGNFRLVPLYAFKGQPDAGFPYGALTTDGAGHYFGTSYYDGANDLGAVYMLTNSGGTWKEKVLYSFRGGTDGTNPISNVLLDGSGNLYGTTSEGGGQSCGCGTIFALSLQGGAWHETVAYRFTGTPDGGFPYNGIVAAGDGTFFGATVHGGQDDEGSVYHFTPSG